MSRSTMRPGFREVSRARSSTSLRLCHRVTKSCKYPPQIAEKTFSIMGLSSCASMPYGRVNITLWSLISRLKHLRFGFQKVILDRTDTHARHFTCSPQRRQAARAGAPGVPSPSVRPGTVARRPIRVVTSSRHGTAFPTVETPGPSPIRQRFPAGFDCQIKALLRIVQGSLPFPRR